MASSLSEVHSAVGNVKSGTIKTGKYSSSGSTSYTSSSGYGGGSSGKTSRVKYEDDPNQPGGLIPTTRIDVDKTGQTTVTDITTGKTIVEGKLEAGTKASDVSIPELQLKSYQQQKEDIAIQEYSTAGGLFKKVSQQPTDSAGDPISSRYTTSLVFSPTNKQEYNPEDYVGKSPIVNKVSQQPTDSAGEPISSRYTTSLVVPIQKPKKKNLFEEKRKQDLIKAKEESKESYISKDTRTKFEKAEGKFISTLTSGKIGSREELFYTIKKDIKEIKKENAERFDKYFYKYDKKIETKPAVIRFGYSFGKQILKTTVTSPETIPISYGVGALYGTGKSLLIASNILKNSIKYGEVALGGLFVAGITAEGLGFKLTKDDNGYGYNYEKPKDYAISFGSSIGKEVIPLTLFGMGASKYGLKGRTEEFTKTIKEEIPFTRSDIVPEKITRQVKYDIPREIKLNDNVIGKEAGAKFKINYEQYTGRSEIIPQKIKGIKTTRSGIVTQDGTQVSVIKRKQGLFNFELQQITKPSGKTTSKLYVNNKGIGFTETKPELIKRLSPEQEALRLQREGKIIYKPTSINLNKEDFGFYEYTKRKDIKTGKIKKVNQKIEIRKGLSEKMFKTTLSHELIHYKTPNKYFSSNKNIPYLLRPQEIIAFRGEKYYAKRGFKLKNPIIKRTPKIKTFEKIEKRPQIMSAPDKYKSQEIKFKSIVSKDLIKPGKKSATVISNIGTQINTKITTQKPSINKLEKTIIDFNKGTITKELKDIEIFETKYKIIKENKKLEPRIITKETGGIRTVSPSIAKVNIDLNLKDEIKSIYKYRNIEQPLKNINKLYKINKFNTLSKVNVKDIINKKINIESKNSVSQLLKKTNEISIPFDKTKLKTNIDKVKYYTEKPIIPKLKTENIALLKTSTLTEEKIKQINKYNQKQNTFRSQVNNQKQNEIKINELRRGTINNTKQIDITKQIIKTNQQQQQITKQAMITKQITEPKTITSINFDIKTDLPISTINIKDYFVSTPIIKIPDFNIKKKKKSLFFETYNVLVKKYGKFQVIGENLTKGRALKLGATETKKTLAATFTIAPTGKLTSQKDISFKPSQKIFRSYSYSGSEKTPLTNTYIQRTTKEGGLKGGRLSSGSEIKQILSAKMRK